MAENGYL